MAAVGLSLASNATAADRNDNNNEGDKPDAVLPDVKVKVTDNDQEKAGGEKGSAIPAPGSAATPGLSEDPVAALTAVLAASSYSQSPSPTPLSMQDPSTQQQVYSGYWKDTGYLWGGGNAGGHGN